MAWWPLGRDRGAAVPPAVAAPAPAPVVAATGPADGAWRDLPAVQRTLAEPLVPVTAAAGFSGSLATFANPSFLAPLAHEVDPAVGGLVHGLADLAPGSPHTRPGGSELAVPPRLSAPSSRPRLQRRSVSWPETAVVPTVPWELPDERVAAPPGEADVPPLARAAVLQRQLPSTHLPSSRTPPPTPFAPSELPVVVLQSEAPGPPAPEPGPAAREASLEATDPPTDPPTTEAEVRPLVGTSTPPSAAARLADGSSPRPTVVAEGPGPQRDQGASQPPDLDPTATTPAAKSSGPVAEPGPALPVVARAVVGARPLPLGSPAPRAALPAPASVGVLGTRAPLAVVPPPLGTARTSVSEPVQRVQFLPPTGGAGSPVERSDGPALGSAIAPVARERTSTPSTGPAVPAIGRPLQSLAPPAPADLASAEPTVSPGEAGRVPVAAEAVDAPVELTPDDEPAGGPPGPVPLDPGAPAVRVARLLDLRQVQGASPAQGGPPSPGQVPVQRAVAASALRQAQRPGTAQRPGVAQGWRAAQGPGAAQGAVPVQRAAASVVAPPVVLRQRAAETAPGRTGGGVSFASMFAGGGADPGVGAASWASAASAATDGFTSVQLESADAAPPAAPAEPAEAPPATTSDATPAPGGGASAADLEEMARRLYEPLTARLRAELWLDRERSGLMTDIR